MCMHIYIYVFIYVLQIFIDTIPEITSVYVSICNYRELYVYMYMYVQFVQSYTSVH